MRRQPFPEARQASAISEATSSSGRRLKSFASSLMILPLRSDQRNFHPPGCDTDTAGADGSRLRAERVLHSEGDHGAVHEHDNILRRALWSRRGGVSIVSLICMSGLLACDRSTERRLRPVHEGRATMGCRLGSSRLKGKSPLAMELIADRYRKAGARLGSCGESAALVPRGFARAELSAAAKRSSRSNHPGPCITRLLRS